MLCSSAPFPHKSNHKAYLLYTDLVHTIMVTLLTTENVQSSVFEHRKDIFSIRCSKVKEGKLTFFEKTDIVWSNMVEHNVMLFSVLSIFILFLTYIADSVACKKPLFCIRFAKKKKRWTWCKSHGSDTQCAGTAYIGKNIKHVLRRRQGNMV